MSGSDNCVDIWQVQYHDKQNLARCIRMEQRRRTFETEEIYFSFPSIVTGWKVDSSMQKEVFHSISVSQTLQVIVSTVTASCPLLAIVLIKPG
jgi:hypothetical protein